MVLFANATKISFPNGCGVSQRKQKGIQQKRRGRKKDYPARTFTRKNQRSDLVKPLPGGENFARSRRPSRSEFSIFRVGSPPAILGGWVATLYHQKYCIIKIVLLNSRSNQTSFVARAKKKMKKAEARAEARAAAIHLKPRPQAERHLTAGRQDYELEFLK
jgi:hypothetical protein